ncbi:unnamed protein product [Mucor hiemalis]
MSAAATTNSSTVTAAVNNTTHATNTAGARVGCAGQDMTDPNNWDLAYRQQFIMLVHDINQLPENHHLLFNPDTVGLYRTCSRCFKVKHKTRYSKRQWKSNDDDSYCVRCIDEDF